MKYLSFIFLIFLSSYLYADEYYYYSWREGEDNMGIAFLIQGNRYEISSSIYGRGCSILRMPVSYGFIRKSAGKAILYDVGLGYEMQVYITDSNLKVIKGFEAFKHVSFSGGYIPKVNGDTFYDSAIINDKNRFFSKPDVDSAIFYDNICTGKMYSFSNGVYSSGKTLKYEYIIFEKSTYTYKTGERILTIGNWKRVGNYIILQDITLDTYFKLRIVQDELLQAGQFPFQLFGAELKKIK